MKRTFSFNKIQSVPLILQFYRGCQGQMHTLHRWQNSVQQPQDQQEGTVAPDFQLQYSMFDFPRPDCCM